MVLVTHHGRSHGLFMVVSEYSLQTSTDALLKILDLGQNNKDGTGNPTWQVTWIGYGGKLILTSDLH